MSTQCPPREILHWGLYQKQWGSLGPSGKLLPIITLNSQGETKIKIKEKSCQILVDTRATFPILNPALRGQQIPQKGGKKKVSIAGVSNEVQSIPVNWYK